MKGYRIDAAGVGKVLRATVKEAEDLGTVVKPLPGTFGKAVTAAGGSGAIAMALTTLMAEHSTRLKTIGTRTGAAVSGAYKATKAYQSGDTEMVQNAQRAAVRAARTKR